MSNTAGQVWVQPSASAKVNSTGNTVDLVLKTMEVRFLQLFFGFGEFGDEEIDGEGRIGKGKGRGCLCGLIAR